MIKPLRKRHLQIWLLLGLLLPFGIVSAWLSIPKPVYSELLQPAARPNLPILLKSVDKAAYTASLRTNQARSVWQLEWTNKKPMASPGALIYLVNGDRTEIEKADIVGRISARGEYHFFLKENLQASGMQLLLYDTFHEQVIDRIKF